MAKKDKEKMLFAGIRKGIIDTNRICKEVEIYTDGYKLYLKYERNPDTCAVCGEHTHSRILCNGKPVCRQCMMKMKEWSENYQTQKIHLLDTGYASAVSLSGNRYLVFIPQDLTDTMFKSYDKNKTLVGELFDDEFLVINDRDEQDHNCYFCGKVNAPLEIENKHICYNCAKEIAIKGECKV